MQEELKVQPAGLLAVAQRLRDAAAGLSAVGAAVHPPLASDQTSRAAAAGFNTGASTLRSAAGQQAAGLIGTADHLTAIAAGFTEQESLNASSMRYLTSAQPVKPPDVVDPVPPTPADVLPPMPPVVAVTGETAARQLHAGSSSAGAGFIHSCRGAHVAAVAAADLIHNVLPALPDLWSSDAGVRATTTRLVQHAEAAAHVAALAAALADQAESHSRSYAGAVAQTPTPEEFETVRDRLNAALQANAAYPGRYTPLVSSLIGQHGALQQKALNTQSQYHEDTAAAVSPEQAGQFAAQLPGMLPAMLGAIGGLAGGAVGAAAQIPQALMQTGQQLAQAAVEGLSGTATSLPNEKHSSPNEFDKSPASLSGARGQGVAGHTTPASATAMAPLSTSPPPSASVPGGTAPGIAVAGAGTTPMPIGMPMGMLPQPPSGGAEAQVLVDKTIVVPTVPNTESVTGRVATDRLATPRAVTLGSLRTGLA